MGRPTKYSAALLEKAQHYLDNFEQYDEVIEKYPDLQGRKLIHETIRRMINAFIVDLIETSTANLKLANLEDIQGVRSYGKPLIHFSDEMKEKNLELKRFLRTHLYRHYRVHRMSLKADKIINTLFHAFIEDTRLLPPEYQLNAKDYEIDQGEAGKARAIADYIAGMTDRYAITEYERVFSPAQLT